MSTGLKHSCQEVIPATIIYNVEIKSLHHWQVSIAQARHIQLKLAKRVLRTGQVTSPNFIAGVDISANNAGGDATGAVVVLSYPELKPVEIRMAQGKLDYPYVPGFLSFREAPLALAACQQLTVTPDLMVVDGQGIVHPQRIGLAAHIGLFLNTPTIGCAKSRLCGSFEMPDEESGSHTNLMEGGETIGAGLRTKSGVKPVYVSIGHKIDLQTALYWILACCRSYRLPESTRLAHLAARGNLKPE
ncbi:deoxyribonuclease V [Chloroflexota bacterium]